MKAEIKFANYGQERERIATESEAQIFELLKQMSGIDELRLVRKCDDYVTAMFGEWDVARIKYTPRAKWVVFPTVEKGSTKHRIESPEEVLQLDDLLQKSIEHIRKYS